VNQQEQAPMSPPDRGRGRIPDPDRAPGQVGGSEGDQPTMSGGRPRGGEDVRSADLRAADTDREYVTGQLGRALAEGRLDLGELDERVTAAWAARTYGELAALTADLPFVEPPRPVPSRNPSTPGADTGSLAHPLTWTGGTGVWLAVGLINVVVWGGIVGTLVFLWWIVIIVAGSVLLVELTSGKDADHPGADR